MTRVFLSHASADSAFAEKLANDLRAFGVDTWLDASHMGPGDFVARINAALERDVLLLVLTPAAIASPWVQQEMNAAITRANQKLMRSPLVLLAAPCDPAAIPALWTVYHRYDATQNYMATLAAVVGELGRASPGQYLPTLGTAGAGVAPVGAGTRPRSGWRPSYPKLAFIPLPCYAVVAVLWKIVFANFHNMTTNITHLALAATALTVITLVPAGLIAIGNAVAVRSKPWTIALCVSAPLGVVWGIPTALMVLAFALYGPVVRQP